MLSVLRLAVARPRKLAISCSPLELVAGGCGCRVLFTTCTCTSALVLTQAEPKHQRGSCIRPCSSSWNFTIVTLHRFLQSSPDGFHLLLIYLSTPTVLLGRRVVRGS